jgi:hypothetical protein
MGLLAFMHRYRTIDPPRVANHKRTLPLNMDKQSSAYTGIVTARLLILGKVETRPDGLPCNSEAFLRRVRATLERGLKSGVAPLSVDILWSSHDVEKTERMLGPVGITNYTLIDEIIYRWEWKRDIRSLGKRGIKLEVVEDGIEADIFKYVPLLQYGKSPQNSQQEDITTAASSLKAQGPGEQSCSGFVSATRESLPVTSTFRWEKDSRFPSCSVM